MDEMQQNQRLDKFQHSIDLELGTNVFDPKLLKLSFNVFAGKNCLLPLLDNQLGPLPLSQVKIYCSSV